MTTFERAVEAMEKADSFGFLQWPEGFIVYSRKDASARIKAIKTFPMESEAHDEARRMSNRSRLLAALRVIREPSEGMVEAGEKARATKPKWELMIDALIEEAENG